MNAHPPARKSEPRRGLGRGLSALLGEEPVAVAPETKAVPFGAEPRTTGEALVVSMPIDLVAPNPDQPRRRFDEAALEELAASIRERGVLQPIIVRPDPAKSGLHQIVAGERRWRAAQRAGLHALPAIVREVDDRTLLEVAIIENVQRADLNPIEEAEGYAQLIETFGYTQEDLARVVGKSRSHLANLLRLRLLPEEVQAMLREGRISAGHARALVTAPNPAALAREAVAKGMSVRQIEARAKEARAAGDGSVGGAAEGRSGGRAARPEKDADTRLLEGDLSAALGMRVEIVHEAGGEGELRIRYRNLDDLDRICQRLAE
ncbi:ParB/RepB/Spo0J family partition protein [Paralimibaculum aggregatum]|nr:ParB/RepB/Spo0J family partition protein [Limibaculum sp. NKW23]